jgi:hypothetical protein
VKFQPPWRWRWGAILRLTAGWWVVWWVCTWAQILWIAVAGWFVLWVRQAMDGEEENQDQQPLPSPTEGPLLEQEGADQRVVVRKRGAERIVYPPVETAARRHDV